MFRPVALYIGLRYTRAKRRNHFISFISLASMLGIAVGVMVLITVLSVMNGFDEEIRNRIFGIADQVTISTVGGVLPDWNNLDEKMAHYQGVTGIAPVARGEVMLTGAGQVQPGLVMGILPQREGAVSEIGNKMVQGSLSVLKAGQFNIILGQQLADTLGVSVGDKVTVLTSEPSITPMGIMPRIKPFTVAGIFQVGNGFGFDSGLAFIHLNDAQKLFRLGNSISGLRLKLADLYAAPKVANELAQQLPKNYLISNWTGQFGAFFQAIQLEKTMMFLILLLIIAVAAFNLVSTLVMVVTDKRADIAILRTFGATPRTILTIFMVQGCVVGFVGTLLGLIFGVLLATHVTGLVAFIERIFHVQILASNVYYVNYLPSKLQWTDVIEICSAALMMSLVATLYPAWRGAKTQPAEALRYE